MIGSASRAAHGVLARLSLAGSVVAFALFASFLVWIVRSSIDDSARIEAERAEIRAMWSGAELVRICARGQEIYRLDGRLVTGVLGWSRPRQFAADVTPEAACVR